MIIYEILNTVNGKVYIGQTGRDFNIRKNEHIQKSQRGGKALINRAIRKYGIDKFEWTVLCVCETVDELYEKEKHYIDLYKSTDIRFGYNLLEGGVRSPIMKGEDHPMYGRKHTDEAKQKVSIANKGRLLGIIRTQENRDNIAKAKIRTWQITNIETGETFVIQDLQKWCNEHSINRSAIKRPNGSKGFRAVRLD